MCAYELLMKLRERWIRLHSAMAGRTLGSYGGNGRIEYPVHINAPKNLSVGRDVVICSGTMLSCVKEWAGRGNFDGRIALGDRVVVREGVQISAAESVTIGNDTGLGRNVLISDHDHDYRLVDRAILENPITAPRPVIIEDGCYLGAMVRVAPGVRIGRHSTIGYASVVTRDIPPYSVAVGSPARVVRRYDFEKKLWESIDGKGFS
ncbi:MAG: acyltransferase [Planctomycetota bacterium]|jgi:acetyltransferase-like isoleucine patch superfamily enzyme|nr:acyltransferase [Planctomycetota bacterium]